MFDFNTVDDAAIRERVRSEANDFMQHCHFGVQGIAATEADVRAAIARLKESGFRCIAFDTEMIWVPLAKQELGDEIAIHAAVSYPMGRMLPEMKLKHLQKLLDLGVTDTCVCLDWQAIFSHEYDRVEREARMIMDEFGDKFVKNAFVIPATHMSDTELIDTLHALDQAGVVSVKVNPGANLNVSFEEVAVINRHFPGRFDIHPSGGIRTLDAVERYREMGCNIIHTRFSLDIVQDFIVRQLKKYGGLQ